MNYPIVTPGMAIRLQVRLKQPAIADLVNAPLPPVKGHVEERGMKPAECCTPAGLPLWLYAHSRGNWGDVVVRSAETQLLRLSIHVNSYAELWLPTDEIVAISLVDY